MRPPNLSGPGSPFPGIQGREGFVLPGFELPGVQGGCRPFKGPRIVKGFRERGRLPGVVPPGKLPQFGGIPFRVGPGKKRNFPSGPPPGGPQVSPQGGERKGPEGFKKPQEGGGKGGAPGNFGFNRKEERGLNTRVWRERASPGPQGSVWFPAFWWGPVKAGVPPPQGNGPKRRRIWPDSVLAPKRGRFTRKVVFSPRTGVGIRVHPEPFGFPGGEPGYQKGQAPIFCPRPRYKRGGLEKKVYFTAGFANPWAREVRAHSRQESWECGAPLRGGWWWPRGLSLSRRRKPSPV